MEPTRKSPTIKDVASASGVSIQTVSRVINNRPDVADKTRDRVKRVIEEIGYQPSALARSLIRNESLTLGVVTAGLKYIGPSRTLNGITREAEEAGYSLLLKELPEYTTTDIVPIVNEFRSRHVDGIIWAAPEIGDNRKWIDESLESVNMPVVYLTMASRDDISVITVDNYQGAELAVNHLLENAYSKIGHIAGPLDWWEACQRFKAWKEIVGRSEDIDIEKCWAGGNWSSRSGAEAMAELFKKAPDIDAVFVANDQMALGALSVIRNKGLRVPDDIGVVGFDNIAESEFFNPPLTTIQHDNIAVGVQAVREIIRIIDSIQNNKELDYRVATLEPRLLVRESSVCLDGKKEVLRKEERN